MSHYVQPPESDLIGLDPSEHAGRYRPHTVHTHYFGFQIPEAEIGCYSYIRYQPFFPLMQGSVQIFQGMDNTSVLDMAHLDYSMTLPWPKIDGNTITTSRGYRIEFLEPGRKARISYRSEDGRAAFELEQTALSPLVGRAAVIPGEDLFAEMSPGGSEQFMHCVGELTLRGRTYPIDCNTVRDRSWNQDRNEDRRGRFDIPVSWTPVYFGDGGYFNQVGFEKADSDPAWAGVLDPPPADYSGALFAWVGKGEEIREIVRVRRNVTELHPTLHFPLAQEIEAEDSEHNVLRMTGRAVAASPIVAWPHAAAYDSVYRWETDGGAVGYGPCQGVWYEGYQHAMKSRRASAGQT
jgi:hypothetical protein